MYREWIKDRVKGSLKKRVPRMVDRLPEKHLWSPHNLVGHPLAEIAHLLGKPEWDALIHDMTLPRKRPLGEEVP